MFCITIDFDTIEKNTITIRYRDTMQQETINLNELDTFIQKNL